MAKPARVVVHIVNGNGKRTLCGLLITNVLSQDRHAAVDDTTCRTCARAKAWVDARPIVDLDGRLMIDTLLHERCSACGGSLGKEPQLVNTGVHLVYVSADCARLIQAAGTAGYLPPSGGPRLWLITPIF